MTKALDISRPDRTQVGHRPRGAAFVTGPGIAWFDPAQEKATVRFLPRARRVEISSDAQPETVIERLRRLVADWRGSTLAAAALQAGISGWSIEERRDLLVLRPRPTERGSPLVIFEGIVQKSPSGSSISGRIRLHPLARLLLVVVAVMAAAVPIGALFETVPREDWHQHVVRASRILPISLLIVAGGLLLAAAGVQVLSRHVLALLNAAAQGSETQAG